MKASPKGQEIVRHASLATISSRVLVGTLALVLVGMGTGCVDNGKSLVIAFNVAPDDSCKFTVQTGTQYIYYPSGELDVKASLVYWLTPQIENYLPSNLNTSEKDLNTMSVQVERAEVRYTWLVGRSIIESYPDLIAIESQDPFIAPISGVVSAADDTGEPGKMLTSIPLLSAQAGDSISQLGASDLFDDLYNVVLGARVRVYGHTLGGTPVRSGEFVYPLYFCSGCTVGYMCCAGTATETLAIFCIAGQDSHLPCSC
jgi:hypothetical protein